MLPCAKGKRWCKTPQSIFTMVTLRLADTESTKVQTLGAIYQCHEYAL